MEKNLSLSDRLRQLIDHYGLSVNELAKKLGGARMKYYNLLSGASKPDFDTTETILKTFPEVSAEWFMRGVGPMLTKDIVSKEDYETVLAENKVIKSLYKAELSGKAKDAALLSPDSRDRNLRKIQFNDHTKSLKGKRGISKSVSGRVQGAVVPSLLELFKQD